MKLTSGEFVLYYLRYLTKWNKTASLQSVIDSYDTRTNHPKWDKELLNTLINVATFEYSDTQSMTSDKVMSMEEVLNELQRRDRDKKLNDILK
jgi:hypothetical protein